MPRDYDSFATAVFELKSQENQYCRVNIGNSDDGDSLDVDNKAIFSLTAGGIESCHFRLRGVSSPQI